MKSLPALLLISFVAAAAAPASAQIFAPPNRCSSANLTMTKSGPATANWTTDTITYTIGFSASNLVGGAGCFVDNVSVVDTLPTGAVVQSVGATPSGWNAPVITATTVTYTHSLDITAPESASFTISVTTGAKNLAFLNSVDVTKQGSITNTGTHPATWTTVVTPVELQHFRAE